MHEEDIIALYHILDEICRNDYLKGYIQNELRKKKARECDVSHLFLTIRKVMNEVGNFNDGQEYNVPILQDLRVSILKN